MTAEALIGTGTDELSFGALMFAFLSDPVIVAAVVLLVTTLAVLGVAIYIVRKTGDTKGLLHLAELVRALRQRKP
ncbi:hypothetical protein AB0K14_28045 [Actinosynnema sp. NPDC050801]|uniref:hypothetical protein n=1 Tax=unclassified Actinosynnema TaxID=2637065 RepID=UPI00340C61DE